MRKKLVHTEYYALTITPHISFKCKDNKPKKKINKSFTKKYGIVWGNENYCVLLPKNYNIWTIKI